MNRLKIIYVFGSGHSGSTLTGLLLGAHSRIACVGEVKAYEYPIVDERCNCGELAGDCRFWQSVHQRAGVEPTPDTPILQRDAARFSEGNIPFLNAILAETEKDFLCDSSKSKKRILRYLDSPEYDVWVLHLVRDGRAMAYSNFKKSRSFWNYAVRWLKRNILERRKLFRAGLSRDRYHQIRYEDLVTDPERVLSGFLQKIGLEFEAKQLEDWSTGNHHIAGNPMGKKAKQNIRPDTGYIEKLTPGQWWGGSLLASVGLMLFKYPFARSGARQMLEVHRENVPGNRSK